jgi:hypothetical protein
MANATEPYNIDIPDTSLDDIKTRLSLAKFPDELDGAGWDLGAPMAESKRLTAYWRDEYDWRRTEKKLNKLPHFTTTIIIGGSLARWLRPSLDPLPSPEISPPKRHPSHLRSRLARLCPRRHQPRELRIVPSTWYRKIDPLLFDRHNDSGGHFWAWEKPESVVRHLGDMFRKPETGGDEAGEGIGGAFGVVEGRSGYV